MQEDGQELNKNMARIYRNWPSIFICFDPLTGERFFLYYYTLGFVILIRYRTDYWTGRDRKRKFK